MLSGALEYACRGWPVFPCSGKVPRTAHGLKDASTDPEQIRAWWDRWPDANLAIVTGARSGLVVVDVDAKSGGLKSYARLAGLHGHAATVTARTGGGGLHFYFAHPGGHVPNSIGKIAPGIDLRADGGYVIAPPSVGYEWIQAPGSLALAPLPSWAVQKREAGAARPPSEWVEALREIREGSRNDTIAAIAGRLFRTYLPPELVAELVHCVNEARCRPPLEPAEVERTIESIAVREAARLMQRDAENRAIRNAFRSANG